MSGDRNRLRYSLVPACALLAALTLAGCTGPGAPGASPSETPRATPTASATLPTPTPNSEVTPGTIEQTVAPRTQKTAAAVNLDQAQASGKVTVTLEKIARQRVKGVGPGEISGPSLVLTILIRNGARTKLNVDSTFVNLIDAKGRAAIPLTNTPYRPFQGSIAPGGSATGVYIFRVPTAARSKVSVSVTYSAHHKTALFVGDAR